MDAAAEPLSALRRRPELDGVSLACYAGLASLGFLLNGLGPVLSFLEVELSAARAQVAWFPLLFACGLVGVGLVGHRIVAIVGRRSAFWAAMAALCGGAVILGAGRSTVVVGIGAGVMGVGGAMLVVLIPAILADRHGRLAAAAIAEANAISSAASVLAPLLVAATASVGAGWRPGYVILPLAVVAVAAIRGRRLSFAPRGPSVTSPDAAVSGPVRLADAAGSFWRRWLDLVIVVSVEFCIVFWSSDYLATEAHVPVAVAPALASLFLVGMAAGRLAGGQAGSRLARPRPVFVSALGLSAVGFVVFWATSQAVVVALGLLLVGLGVALLYPLSLARALAAAPGVRDRASARAALGSGLAVGLAPFALALLAEQVGLRQAFLVVPVLLAAALANTVLGQPPRHALSDGDRPVTVRS